MRFDFDSETRRRLGHRLIDQIDDFYSSLPDRAVQLPAEQRSYGPIHNPLPEEGEDAGEVLDELCREMVDQGFHVPSANYFGLMNPTPTYMGVLAEALVAGLNPQLATLARSQLASKIELETVRWIGERVGWPGEFNGTFTSGGNEANFSGIALALASKFPRLGRRRRCRDRGTADALCLSRVPPFAGQVCRPARNRAQGIAANRGQ